MPRYTRIRSVAFGAVELAMPTSVRLWRKTDALLAAGERDMFATSVQVASGNVSAEVRVRDVSAADGLALGATNTLTITVAPGGSGSSDRVIQLTGAVLVSVETVYEQASAATAVLRFVAQATDGQVEPFFAGDVT